MKILQIIAHYVPAAAFGGPLQVAHGFSRALVALGHEVTVVCTNMKSPTEDLDVPVDCPVPVDGARVFYERVPLLRYWGWSPGLKRRAGWEARDADVVFTHFHYQYASVAGGAAARHARRPLVIFPHGSLSRHGMAARSSSRKDAYLRLVEGRNFRHALFLACHSPEEPAQSLPLAPMEIVPVGVEFDPATPPRGTFRRAHPQLGDRFVFAFLGRLAEGKGLELLVPALAQVARRRPVHLLLIGGDERGFTLRLRAQIAEQGIEASVTFTGLLRGPDKFAALQDADAFVLPSRSEGVSVATLEAMASGLPVLITDRVGIWREVKEARAGYVISYAREELAAALDKMSTEPDRRQMGERGRAWVRGRYAWNATATALVEKIATARTASRV